VQRKYELNEIATYQCLCFRHSCVCPVLCGYTPHEELFVRLSRKYLHECYPLQQKQASFHFQKIQPLAIRLHCNVLAWQRMYHIGLCSQAFSQSHTYTQSQLSPVAVYHNLPFRYSTGISSLVAKAL